MKYARTLASAVLESSKTFRSILVAGPRQVGKTTLLRDLVSRGDARGFVSLDNPDERALARRDPALFLQLHKAPLLIDEVQYAPELFPFLKMKLDDSPARGQYWLTGSQRFTLMKGVTESLAGRIAIFDLQGLSQRESRGDSAPRPFCPPLSVPEEGFSDPECEIGDVYEKIVKGSFPELFDIPEMNVSRFFTSYTATYIERDVRSLVNVTNESLFGMFLRVVAARTGQLLNYTDLAKDVGVSVVTVRAWMSILETSGIIYLLRPYFYNMTKRVVKTPKVYFLDTGLCCSLCGISTAAAAIASPMSGALLETFVVSEALKSYWHAGEIPRLFFFRDAAGHEVDLVIERDGALHPVEIKRAAGIDRRDIEKNWQPFRQAVGDKCGTGAVLRLAPAFSAWDRATFLMPVTAV